MKQYGKFFLKMSENAVLGSSLHQESAPLDFKAKTKVLDSVKENLG